MKKLERIYEEIAKRHGTTAERVRRDIRSALNMMFALANLILADRPCLAV